MLLELTIRNFAIIDELHLRWEPGLNVLTGETGAGKSIVLDAVGGLLGDRLGAEVVRTGAERAYVEGVFTIAPGDAALRQLLAEHDLLDAEDQLIVSRDIARTGRSVGRVNGRAVSLALLQAIGERLVDVHGQSQHLSLLRGRAQLDLLDHYAGLENLRSDLAAAVAELRQVEREIAELLTEERRWMREVELLRHEVREIDAAALQVGEEERLQTERTRLRSAERLRRLAHQIHQALQGDDERPGAVGLLEAAALVAADLARLDSTMEDVVAALNDLAANAEEIARRLQRYADDVEEDPERLQAVEERLHLIADLRRKYGDSIADILRYRTEAAARLEQMEHREERVAALQERRDALRATVGTVAGELARRRRAAAERLAREVEAELADLHLRGTSFRVAFATTPSESGVLVDVGDGTPRPLAFETSGVDRIEFLIAPNPGEEPRPLARIASGGELARIALALKTSLGRADTIPTLVFDEVDVGVGGRSGEVVGMKLWTLALDHQVLCVTHLPQVAAFGDAHYVVTKAVERDDRTVTRVRRIADDEVVDELATMMAGRPVTEAARTSARELLARAADWKAARRLATTSAHAPQTHP